MLPIEELQEILEAVAKINEEYSREEGNEEDLVSPLTIESDVLEYCNICMLGGYSLWRSFDDERECWLDSDGEEVYEPLEGFLRSKIEYVGNFLLKSGGN